MNDSKINSIPRHIGIIMDGNGRWANRKDHPRVHGHQNATTAVRDAVEGCAELGVEALTLYAFSTENWSRPPEEVNVLMILFEEYLKKETPTMMKHNIRLKLVGGREKLPDFVLSELDKSIQKTAQNSGMVLCLAVNYGGRDEILRAARALAEKAKTGQIAPNAIDERAFENELFTTGLPDPDLIIRTSGEIRLSNFLLWQAAYAEFYFTDLLWPDFNKAELHKAIEAFSQRVRRIGNVHAQK